MANEQGFLHVNCLFSELCKKRKRASDGQSSTSSQISTDSITQIIDRFKMQRFRDSTKKNYYNLWRIFNKFFIRLDKKPRDWGDRLTLFVGHLVNEKKQSSTIKSYISAIRAVLKDNDIPLKTNEFLLTSLTRACQLVNDTVKCRLPIQKPFLEIIMRKLNSLYNSQPYLRTLYRCIISTMYFGLFRISELTKSPHVVLAKDVNIANNKKKFLFILRSSKTHVKGNKPQMIKN